MAGHAGFIGSAWVQTSDTSAYPGGGPGTGTDGISLLLTGSTLNPKQEINAQDVVQGQIVKHAYNYGKVEIGGNVSAPIDEYHKALFDSAWARKYGDGIHDSPDHMADESIVVKISYYRSAANNARVFNNLAINSYELTVNAGDVANFTCDFMGASNYVDGELVPALTTEHFNSPAPCSKFVTWDRCAFSLVGFPVAIQSFTLTVNNNLERLYKVRSNLTIDQDSDPMATLYPVELIAKFRDLTGNISAFLGDAGTGETPVEGAPEEEFQPAGWQGGAGGTFGAENWSAYTASGMEQSVRVIVGEGLSTPIIDRTFNAVFTRPDASATTAVSVVTLNWTGLCYENLT